MSRTIRRKGKKTPDWLAENKKGRDIVWYTSWSGRKIHINEREKWEYHTDAWRSDPCMSKCKEHTDRIRRADQRIIDYNVAKDPDFDYYDLEKKYLGFIWIFD